MGSWEDGRGSVWLAIRVRTKEREGGWAGLVDMYALNTRQKNKGGGDIETGSQSKGDEKINKYRIIEAFVLFRFFTNVRLKERGRRDRVSPLRRRRGYVNVRLTH